MIGTLPIAGKLYLLEIGWRMEQVYIDISNLLLMYGVTMAWLYIVDLKVRSESIWKGVRFLTVQKKEVKIYGKLSDREHKRLCRFIFQIFQLFIQYLKVPRNAKTSSLSHFLILKFWKSRNVLNRKQQVQKNEASLRMGTKETKQESNVGTYFNLNI